MSIRVLTGSMNAHNTVDAPETVKIESFTDFTRENGGVQLTLPPCCVAAIELA